jgi:hypothetical protein
MERPEVVGLCVEAASGIEVPVFEVVQAAFNQLEDVGRVLRDGLHHTIHEPLCWRHRIQVGE